MSSNPYVHGYSPSEFERLSDQANALSRLLHHDSIFNPAGLVLEAGCGTGMQTVIVAPQNPTCSFVSIDISRASLATAGEGIRARGIQNVKFQVADIFDLPFANDTFDHVFICFVLEHLSQPAGALNSLKRVLKKGGTITVIKGDHGSVYYHPASKYAQAAIDCLVDIQATLGGNSLVGRELYPLLVSVGFSECRSSPRVVYADGRRPELQDGFTRKTFTAMVEGVREEALGRGLMSQGDWEKGIADLYRTAEPDGTFSYTFFKATGLKP